MSKAEVHKNGDWFSRWTFLDVLDLTRTMTIGQMTAREDFAKRIAAEKPVYLHECLYPLMQGRDSVEIKADVELGGTEQLFSLLVARDLQQLAKAGAAGGDDDADLGRYRRHAADGQEPGQLHRRRRAAENQFGKIMSIPDEPMRQYFTLLTELPITDIDRLLSPDNNPRDAKEILGKQIVAQYHGLEAAELAAAEFRRRAAGQDPDEIPDVFLAADKLDPEGRISTPSLLKELGLESSTSNARRLIEQGGVSVGASDSARRLPTSGL